MSRVLLPKVGKQENSFIVINKHKALPPPNQATQNTKLQKEYRINTTQNAGRVLKGIDCALVLT